ncbi:NUDIX domain-containing protein [Rhizomonospora bruguierae]|uniref:NUDIX domain-containing protein n=1 Tax=Rhizomonospora bruguierae TaxID=1581705 RepID=UPI001BD06766|nr:NUDIX domain-containing protein [Micromonospora sp. NBRC 107566]
MTTGARFCPRCGGALAGPPPTACPHCGYAMFVNARPTANLILLDGDGRFLSVRRAIPPRAGLWELPGGFCDGWEHPADAAVREAREELGIDVELGELVGLYIGSYEYQNELLPVLDAYFIGHAAEPTITLNAAEVSDMAWFDLADPPPMAFESMDRALRDAAKVR